MAHPDALVKSVARGETLSGEQISPAVVDSAIEHRMAALLLGAIEDPSVLAPEVAASLTAFDMAVTARRVAQDRVVSVLHQRLDAAGVTHTFVKGPASARRWFERPTDRPFSDVDLVVPPGHHFSAALAELAPTHPALDLLGGQGYQQFLTAAEMTMEDVRVDLQTDALRMGLTPRDTQGWTVGTDRLGPESLPVLDPEHDLVMFLLHQARDRFRFLLGVAELRRRMMHHLDWDRVEALARREGIFDQVGVALEVMCSELGITTPLKAPSGWRSALWRRMWHEDVRLLGEIGRIRHVVRGRWLMPILVRGRSGEAMVYLLRALFPPDAIMRQRYPTASGPYLWRVLATRFRVIGRRRLWVWRSGP
jgi:hypothetical protein